MFGNKIIKAALVTIAAGISFAAQAELIDQYTTASSEFAQVYKNNTSINMYIEGAGINQTISLSHYNTSTGYWRGVIPASSVTVNGIASISVTVNTCDYIASSSWGTDPCGLVDVTFNKADYLWKTNGVSHYTWGDTIRQYVGGISTFSASATGTIKGVSIDSTRAYMGKYNNVAVVVSTVN
jgi:hypothetical protein